MQLADAAIKLDEYSKSQLTTEMQRLTSIENPNSVYQLLELVGAARVSVGFTRQSTGKGIDENNQRACEVGA